MVWWSAAGLIHYDFLNPGETIIAERDASEITAFACDNRKGPILLHDNARPHVAASTLQKLKKTGLRESSTSPKFTGSLANRLELFQTHQ